MPQRGVSKAREQRLRQGGIFAPLVFAFAARLEGLPVEEFLDSPTKIVNGLRSVFGHFGTDSMTCWCDDTALAAALGYSRDWSTYPPGVIAPATGVAPATDGPSAGDLAGPAAVATDVVRRLGQLMPDTVLAGTMPGPGSLAAQVSGSPGAPPADPDALRAAAKDCLAYAKSLCDAGLDILLVREDRLPEAGDDLTAGDVARLYSPIWNTARHYGVAALLAPRPVDGTAPESLPSLAAAVDGVVVPPQAAAGLHSRFRRIGVGLPSGLLGATAEELHAFVVEHDVAGAVAGGAFLVTTLDEVPLDIDRGALISGIGLIRDLTKEANARG